MNQKINLMLNVDYYQLLSRYTIPIPFNECIWIFDVFLFSNSLSFTVFLNLRRGGNGSSVF